MAKQYQVEFLFSYLTNLGHCSQFFSSCNFHALKIIPFRAFSQCNCCFQISDAYNGVYYPLKDGVLLLLGVCMYYHYSLGTDLGCSFFRF